MATMNNEEPLDGIHDVQSRTSMPQAVVADIEDGRVGRKREEWLLDPENSEEWHIGKKVYHLAVVSMQCFIVTFGSSVYAPATPLVADRFQIDKTTAKLPLTLYVLGLAFGPIVSAPLSETVGRKAVYQILFPLSLLFTLGAGFSQTFTALCVCRFFAGCLGSGCLAVGAATNSDMFKPLYRATTSAVFLLAPFAGPSFGPPIGGYVVQYKKDWRWTQWTILFGGAFATLLGLFQQETHKEVILQKRERKQGLAIPGDHKPLLGSGQKLRFFLMVTFFRPIRMLFTDPIVLLLALYTAFNFGVLYAFFAAFPLVFQSIYSGIGAYNFSTGQSGLVFLGIAVGTGTSAIIVIVIDRLIYVPKARQWIANGTAATGPSLPPEERMYAAMVGSILLPTSLFWFAWTARSSIHWIVPILACIPFGCGNLLVFGSATLYQIDTYGSLSGASAIAANGILRYILGAVFPLFTVQMYEALGVAWATSLLAFITLALLPIPWILFKYGATIREKSKYAITAEQS